MWDTGEAYYIPINTITGIYFGQYDFPSHKKESIHDLLFYEDVCSCGGEKGNYKQCLKQFQILCIGNQV